MRKLSKFWSCVLQHAVAGTVDLPSCCEVTKTVTVFHVLGDIWPPSVKNPVCRRGTPPLLQTLVVPVLFGPLPPKDTIFVSDTWLAQRPAG